MRFFYLFLIIHFSLAAFAQEDRLRPEANLQQLLKTAYEREERLKNVVTEARLQMRQLLPSPAVRDSFDAVFSDLLSGNRKKKTFSTETSALIAPILLVDSFTHLVINLQKLTLQNYRFESSHLGKRTPTGIVLNDTSYLFQQLAFFNIQNHEKVGEIGAGSGSLAFFIGTLYDSVEIQMNEISPGMVERFGVDIAYKLTPPQQMRFRAVQGTAQSTGLEGENLDVIIAVDAFHHFKEKFGMLQSIKWSLAKGGRFYLVEQDKDYQSLHEYCPEAMEKWELEKLLQENGFVKVRERPLLGRSKQKVVMLEYMVNPL